MSKLEITHPAPDGNGTSILIDGVEMKNNIRMGAQIELEHRVRLTMELHMVEDLRLCAENAEVVIGQDSRDMLVRAGWSPPPMGATPDARQIREALQREQAQAGLR